MQCQLDQRDLRLAASLVDLALPGSTAVVPVLQCLEITLEGVEMTWRTTNLTTMVVAHLEVPPERFTRSGQVLVPAKPFLELVRRVTAPRVTLTTTGSTLVVTTPGASHTLPLVEGDLPWLAGWNTGGPPDYVFDPAALRTALGRLRRVVSQDASRPNLNVVALQRGALVASDGLRLSLVTSGLGDLPPTLTLPGGVIPAVRSFTLLAPPLPGSHVSLQEHPTAYVFWAGAVALSVQKSQARFPDVSPVLAQVARNTLQVTLPVRVFDEALERVLLSADPATHTIRLDVAPGELTLSTANASGARATETLPAVVTQDAPLRTYCNGRLLQAAFGTLPWEDTTTLALGYPQLDRPAPLLLQVGDRMEILLATHDTF